MSTKRTLPYFKWYPKDAETDENFRAMSDSEVGFYIRCLNHAWLNHGLPADPTERARALRVRTAYQVKQWQRVSRCFVKSEDNPDRLVNPRQEEERREARLKSEKATKSVRTRYERSTNASPRALARAGSGSEYVSSLKGEGVGGGDFSDHIERIRDFWPNPSQFQVGIQYLTESQPPMGEVERVASEWSTYWRETSNGRKVAYCGAPKFADFVLNWESYRKGPPRESEPESDPDWVK